MRRRRGSRPSARRPISSRPASRAKRAELDTLGSLLDELPEDLGRRVFMHASWVDTRSESYERLAFLGDVVLSLAVSGHLYPRFPDYGAGRLTKLRAQTVSGAACAEVAREIGIPERLRVAAPSGTGKSAEVLIESERVLASLCEAAIGAAYLAFGIDRVAPAVVQAFGPILEEALENPLDYKSVLQERLARRAETVDYAIASEEGPPHDRSFVAVATVSGREIGRGSGKTKKAAEQEAAARALEEGV